MQEPRIGMDKSGNPRSLIGSLGCLVLVAWFCLLSLASRKKHLWGNILFFMFIVFLSKTKVGKKVLGFGVVFLWFVEVCWCLLVVLEGILKGCWSSYDFFLWVVFSDYEEVTNNQKQ